MANELLRTLTIDGVPMDVLVPQTVFVRNETAVSIARSTVNTFSVWTAPKDGYLIATATVVFETNATGYRFMDLLVGDITHGGQRVDATSNGQTQLSSPVVGKVSRGDAVVIRYAQGAAGNINVQRRFFEGLFYSQE